MARDLRDVVESILAGVVVVDAGGRVELLNSAACRLLGFSQEQVVGAPVERLAPPDHALPRLARETLESGVSASEAEQPLEQRGAEPLLLDVSTTPLFEGAEIDGAVVVVRDRAAQRRLEQLEYERARFIDFGRIAAGLAHEVKNPLGGIRGAGELLVRRADDDKTREIAELVVQEATRIAGLVDDFMVFARGESLRAAPVNVHRVLDDVLDLLSLDPLAEGAEVVRMFDPSIPELLADADRLTQVFLNLARNALQSMDRGERTLRIETRMALDPKMAVDDGPPVPGVAIRIADRGCGMSPDALREATTPFFTTRAGGTGLGLAVADYWVAQHQGALEIESTPGEGTTVSVLLPLRRAA